MNHFSLSAIMIDSVLCRSCASNPNFFGFMSAVVLSFAEQTRAPVVPILWLLKFLLPSYANMSMFLERVRSMSHLWLITPKSLLPAHGPVLSIYTNHHSLYEEILQPPETIQTLLLIVAHQNTVVGFYC